MKIDITHRDITSELCRRCAACCRTRANVPNCDSRYRRFLRACGHDLTPPAKEGQKDCCDDVHDIKVLLPPCKHLETSSENGETLHRCAVYGTEDFPDMCADFDCVSWAKSGNSYNDKNELLSQAQTALNFSRMGGDNGGEVKSDE